MPSTMPRRSHRSAPPRARAPSSKRSRTRRAKSGRPRRASPTASCCSEQGLRPRRRRVQQIIEKYPKHPTAYPDALLAARRDVLRVQAVSLGAPRLSTRSSSAAGERGFVSYQSQGARRASSTWRFASRTTRRSTTSSQDNQVPPAAVEGGLSYAGARALRQEGLRRRQGALGAASTPRASTTTRRSTSSASSR